MEIFCVMTSIFIVYIFEKRNYLLTFLLKCLSKKFKTTKILHSVINKIFLNIFKTLILSTFQKNQLSLHNVIQFSIHSKCIYSVFNEYTCYIFFVLIRYT